MSPELLRDLQSIRGIFTIWPASAGWGDLEHQQASLAPSKRYPTRITQGHRAEPGQHIGRRLTEKHGSGSALNIFGRGSARRQHEEAGART